MDFSAFLDGFGVVTEPDEPALLPDRRRHRHAHRRAARPRPGGHHRHPAADHLQHRPGRRRSSCSPASTTAPSTAAPSPRCCCASPARPRRWSPSSTASPWPSRARPAPRSASPPSAPSSAATVSIIGLTLLAPVVAELRARLRPAGVRRAGAARRPAGRHHRQRQQAQGAHRRRGRPAAGHRRPRQLHRRRAASPSAACSSPTASTSSSSPWACSASARSSTTSRSGTASRHVAGRRSPTSGPRARTSSRPPARSAAARSSASSSASCPAAAPCIASLAAYAAEKRVAKHPERFGRGAIEGVAGPETANNAAATSSFIPLLTHRHPRQRHDGDDVRRAADPGCHARARSWSTSDPDLFWGVVNSMYIGNILLLILSIPLVGMFVRILRVRPAILAPITALITILGVYTINNSRLRHLRDDRLRHRRLPDEEVRLRARPDGAGLRPRLPDRVELPPLAADLRRRPDRLLHPARSPAPSWPSSSWSSRCPLLKLALPPRPPPPTPPPTRPTSERTPCDDQQRDLIGYVPTPVGEAALEAGLAEAAARGDDVVLLNSPRRG